MSQSPHLYPSRMAALALLGLDLMALRVQQRRSKHGVVEALVALQTAVGIPWIPWIPSWSPSWKMQCLWIYYTIPQMFDAYCISIFGFFTISIWTQLENIKSQLIQCFVIQGLGLVPTRSPASRWGPLVRLLVSLPCTLDQWHRPGSSGSHKDMPPACQRAGSLHPPPVSGSIEMFLYMYM
jgi:hypothetical protein